MKRSLAILLVAVLLMSLLPAASLAATQYGTVVGGWLRMRSAPNFNASTITSYYTGTQVRILGSSGGWYKVEAPDGRTGYMYGDYLRLSSSGGSTGTGDAYVTSRNGYGVRLRTGPGTGYRIIRTYAVGTPVRVLERGNYWSRISIGGTVGYMMSQFLDFGGSYPDDGTVLCYATIWSGNGYGVRLRTGPSKSYSKIGVYSVGTTVAVLDKGAVWDRVRVGSRVGWMMNEFLNYYGNNEVTSVTINNYLPVVGSVLSMQAVSPHGATVSYEWLVGGAVKSTNSTYTVDASDVGKSIQLRVTGTGSYKGTVTSAATNAVVSNTVLTGVKLNTIAPVVGDVLTATLSPADAKVIYAWKVGGYQVSNAATYTVTANDVGKQIELIVTGTGLFSGTQSSGLTAAVSASRAVADVVIKNETNTAAGAAPSVGDKLTAAVSPAQATVTYQWYRDGAAISGATAASYTAADADVGCKLTVAVRGTGSYTGDKISASTAAVVKKAPVLGLGMPAFSEETVGYAQPAAQAIKVSNTGSADANITGAALSGDTNAFTLNSTSGGAVAAGATDATSWTIQPNAGLAAGSYSATVTFTYDGGQTAQGNVSFVVKDSAPAPVSTLVIDNVAFDSVTAGYTQPDVKYFTIANTGTSDATIAKAYLTGKDATSFILTNGGANIPAGQSVTYKIQPAAGLEAAIYTATLMVEYDGGQTAQADVTFIVTNSGTTTPELTVQELNLGPVKVGYVPNVYPLVIANKINTPATITSVVLTGADADKFQVNTTGSTIIGGDMPDESWNVQPVSGLQAGTYMATVEVHYNGNSPATASVTFTVTDASAPAPVPDLAPALTVAADSGALTQTAGSLTNIPLTIANTSGYDAELTSITVDMANFSVNEKGSSTVPANGSDATWFVIPDPNLQAGSYTVTATVAYQSTDGAYQATASVKIDLKVEAAATAPVAPPTADDPGITTLDVQPSGTDQLPAAGTATTNEVLTEPVPQTESLTDPIPEVIPEAEPIQEVVPEPDPEPAAPAAAVLGIRADKTSVTKGKSLQLTATLNDQNVLAEDNLVSWTISGNASGGTAIDPLTGKLTVAADETASQLKATVTLNSDLNNFFTIDISVKEPAVQQPEAAEYVEVVPEELPEQLQPLL